MRTLRIGIGCLALLGALPCAAQGTRGAVRVLEAHALATVPGATTGVAYVTVHNIGGDRDRLVGATTPGAAAVELHRMAIQGGVMQMRSLGAIDLPVGGSIEMASGGTHLMLVGLKRPLVAGQHFPLLLKFAHAGVVTADVTVEPLGAH